MTPSSRADSPPLATAGWSHGAGAALVAAVAAIGYFALYAAIDVDDSATIAAVIAAGRYEWVPAHLLMQPVAALLYRLAGMPADLLLVLRLINTACAATSLGFGFVLLRRCGVTALPAAAAMAAAWGGFALLQLASSGHVKLLALPWLMVGIMVLAGQDRRAGAARLRAMVAAGLAWGLAAAFLASFTLAGPVVAALVFLRALAGRDWPGVLRAVVEYAVLGAAMAVVLGGALLLGWQASGAANAGESFFGWMLTDTARAETPPLTLIGLARIGVGMVKGFVWIYLLPEAARVWLAGEAPGLEWGAPRLYGEVVAIAACLGQMALAAWWALGAWRRGRSDELAVLGALIAAVVFCAVWGSFEADFQFPITLLTVLGIALRPPLPRLAVALGLVIAAFNVAAYAVPRLSVDAARTMAQLDALVGPADLMICGCPFNGRDSAYHYPLPPPRRLRVAQELLEREGGASAEAFYAALQAQIAATLARGGRVYVFTLLDPADWSPPWPLLHRMGVRKDELLRRLGMSLRIGPTQQLGGLTYREVGAKP